MKPEQLKWTDKEWAAYLGCAVHDIPKFKRYLEENYVLGIWQDEKTNLKYAELQRRHDAPSGAVRYITVTMSVGFDLPLDKMVEFTNNEFVPSLRIRPVPAAYYGVPQKVLQMLHINTKQK